MVADVVAQGGLSEGLVLVLADVDVDGPGPEGLLGPFRVAAVTAASVAPSTGR